MKQKHRQFRVVSIGAHSAAVMGAQLLGRFSFGLGLVTLPMSILAVGVLLTRPTVVIPWEAMSLPLWVGITLGVIGWLNSKSVGFRLPLSCAAGLVLNLAACLLAVAADFLRR